jgi:hypothetical protein
MSSRLLTVALALTSGFAGSILARYVAPPPAFAQQQASPQAVSEIRAQRFTVVDLANRTVGTFEYDASSTARNRYMPPRIVLRDADGRILWSASRWDIQPLSER